jgi:RimJ/RimL family protein N-acetyltransferase
VRLETPRLLLRPFEPADLDDFVALHAEPEVTRYITAFDRPTAEERLGKDAEEWRERGHGMFAVLEREHGTFLGRTAVKHWPQFDETEIGWVLRHEAWGNGYATEAARACVDWAFAEFELPYLTAMIAAANLRSIRVAERLDLTPVRKDMLLDDPVVVYTLQRP